MAERARRRALGHKAFYGPCAVLLVLGVVLAEAQAPVMPPPTSGPAGQVTPTQRTLSDASSAELSALLGDGFILVGDMLMERSHFNYPPDVRRPLGATAFTYYQGDPWPGGRVPLVFDETVDEELQGDVWAMCAKWSQGSGVRCVPWTGQAKYTLVTREHEGCFGAIGNPRGGQGIVNLGLGCEDSNTIGHELGHAFGLIHEHQRGDRDQYVEIRWENVVENAELAFEPITSFRPHTEYDFASITHYDPGAFGRSGDPVIVPRPQYADRADQMGKVTEPSPLDRFALSELYNLPPRALSGPVSRPAGHDRGEFLAAMYDLDVLYRVDLQRANGLSIGGEPDFLGIAAWIFDIYLTARATGYDDADAFWNVRAFLSNTDEWRARNPGRTPLQPVPTFPRIQLDRTEYLDAMYRLDQAYRTELLRPNGLSINGGPDFVGIATWVFDVYLNARLGGEGIEPAWQRVLTAIRSSDEYRAKR